MVGRLTKWAFVFQEECDTTILHVDIIYCLCKITSISIHGNRTVYISKNDSKVTCKVTTIIKNISLWARDHHSFSPKHTDFYSNYWTYPAIIYVRIRISIYMDYTIWYIYIKHKKKNRKVQWNHVSGSYRTEIGFHEFYSCRHNETMVVRKSGVCNNIV